MQKISTFFAGLTLLAACGGGGGGSLQSAALSGHVYQLNGQTQNRAGVEVTVVETGETAVTGVDGSFQFGSIPAGVVTLRFGGNLQAAALRGSGEAGDDNGGGGAEPGDDNGADDVVGETEAELRDVRSGENVEVRAALDGGKLTEFSRSDGSRVRAESRLRRAAGSPDADVEGKVKIETRADREKFAVEADHLDAGVQVEFFLDDPATAEGFLSIGLVTADALGKAELELSTNDGDLLPMGALAAGDLSGFAVEARLASGGGTLLVGEVPELPAADGAPPGDGDLNGGSDENSRGRALLTALQPGLEGHVEIRSRPEHGDEFRMEAEGLATGTQIAFEIADPALPGAFLRLATGIANAFGEAEYETEGILPLGFASAADLVGLEVRVILDDGSATVLLTGEVPPLVED